MISENRWQHILGVARKAKMLAEKLKPNDTQYAEDMFLLGFLHDFGYEFMQENQGHGPVGGAILQRNQYQYWSEVAEHGLAQADMSDELFILNCADMTVGPTGIECSMVERLEDIAVRYGKDSPAYQKALQEMQILQNDRRYKLLTA
jgi:hypothetical protein